MTQFDIIGALRSYCTANGIHFIWQYNEFCANMPADNDYAVGDLVMVVDLLANPDVRNGKVADITYSGLVMLGRKFDAPGTVASLDETALQKYDRRLCALQTDLITHITTFACDNDLQLTVGQIEFILNDYDAIIDFAACRNISFVQ